MLLNGWVMIKNNILGNHFLVLHKHHFHLFGIDLIIFDSRFEKLQAYSNYYKLIATKKVEKVKPSKKPDEPIRIHIRNRYC